MNTFMYGPSSFSFHFLSFSISFPKLTSFTILRLYMLLARWLHGSQDVENHYCAHLRDIELKTVLSSI